MNTEEQGSNQRSEGAERVQQRRFVAPPVDIFENKQELLLVADLPGVLEDRISIRFEKNQLSIEGAFEPEDKKGVLQLQPFTYARTFQLPSGIDGDKIAAELKDGVLRVHLPRHNSQLPRQISVKAV